MVVPPAGQQRKRQATLSITHLFTPTTPNAMPVGRDSTAPRDHVVRRRIDLQGKATAGPSDLDEVVREGFSPASAPIMVFHETIAQSDFDVSQRNGRRGVRALAVEHRHPEARAPATGT